MKTRLRKDDSRPVRRQQQTFPARSASKQSVVMESTPVDFRLKRILVPTDFSTASIKALRYAAPFAEKFGATICLVHVAEPAPFVNDLANVPLIRSDAAEAQDARARLISLARQEIEELIPVNPQVRFGQPSHEIVDLAKSLKTDLIIMATHGRTGLKHVLLGSTAERVVRYAPCPVLVVREHQREFV